MASRSEEAAAPPADGVRHLAHDIAVSGMTCAACAGRVERRLNKLDGVRATVNLATERARVVAPAGTDPQMLTAAVEKAGYTATLLTGTSGDAGRRTDDRTRDLQRLVVAVVLAMPLADLSLALSLFPELRFPGREWVFLALALPMVFWCALPFHRAAWAGLRRGSASMDTARLAPCGGSPSRWSPGWWWARPDPISRCSPATEPSAPSHRPDSRWPAPSPPSPGCSPPSCTYREDRASRCPRPVTRHCGWCTGPARSSLSPASRSPC